MEGWDDFLEVRLPRFMISMVFWLESMMVSLKKNMQSFCMFFKNSSVIETNRLTFTK